MIRICITKIQWIQIFLQENQRLLSGNLRHLRDLLATIGQFDLSDTPQALPQTLRTLYRQLRDYKFAEDDVRPSEVKLLEQQESSDDAVGHSDVHFEQRDSLGDDVGSSDVSFSEQKDSAGGDTGTSKSSVQDSPTQADDNDCQNERHIDTIPQTEQPQDPISHVTTGVVYYRTSSECSETESYVEILNSTLEPDSSNTSRLDCTESDLSTINGGDLYSTAIDLNATSETTTDMSCTESLPQDKPASPAKQNDSSMKQARSETQALIQNEQVPSVDATSTPVRSLSKIPQSLSPGLNEVIYLEDVTEDPRPRRRTLTSTALQGMVGLPSPSWEDIPGEIERSLNLSIDWYM